MNIGRAQKILIAVVVVLILAGLLSRTVMYTVSERELAVILEFGKPVKSVTEPGLNFKKPFIQEVRRLPKTKQLWRSDDTNEPLVDLPTGDGKKIEVSAWAVWRISDEPDGPEQFVRVVRTVENAETDHIHPRVRSAIRNAITTHKLAEAVRSTPRDLTYSIQKVEFDEPEADAEGEVEDDGPLPEAAQQGVQPGEIQDITVGRQKIMQQVEETVRARLQESGEGEGERGIELVDVGISNISFVPSVREAAFERLKASMEAIAAKYENAGIQRKKEILNQTQAEVEKIEGEGEEQSEIIRGEADAEIIRRYAEAINQTGDFYNFIKTLEVNQKALSGQSRLILTTDSELFRMLKEVQPASTPPPTAVTGDGNP